MSTVQKFIALLGGLGAGFLVLTNPEGFYKATTGLRGLVAGSIVDVTTGKTSR